jgi:hypothetical protein
MGDRVAHRLLAGRQGTCESWKHHSRFHTKKSGNGSIATHFSLDCRDCETKLRNERKNQNASLRSAAWFRPTPTSWCYSIHGRRASSFLRGRPRKNVNLLILPPKLPQSEVARHAEVVDEDLPP